MRARISTTRLFLTKIHLLSRSHLKESARDEKGNFPYSSPPLSAKLVNKHDYLTGLYGRECFSKAFLYRASYFLAEVSQEKSFCMPFFISCVQSSLF